ncbi:MAG: hypothetical protein QOD30_1042 [Actinomycetota bacterium]|jgi:hypothetical protein|nr:hypothetical protein [Actinomycetota bacterium]
MAAIVIDSPRWVEGWGEPGTRHDERPALRLVGVGDGTRRPGPRVVRRRRLVAALVLFLLVAVVCGAASVALSRPATAGTVPAPRPIYVVEAGDTYWSIAAARHHGSGDLRIEVDRLLDLNGARPLVAGDRIDLPSKEISS